jgi:cell division septation protein DedD
MVCAGLAAAAFGGIYWSLPETAGAAYRLQRAADLAVQGKGGDVELATAGSGLGAATASSVFVITSDEDEAEAEDEGGDGDGGDGVGEEIKDAEGLSFAGKHCPDAVHDDDHVSTTTVACTSTTTPHPPSSTNNSTTTTAKPKPPPPPPAPPTTPSADFWRFALQRGPMFFWRTAPFMLGPRSERVLLVAR